MPQREVPPKKKNKGACVSGVWAIFDLEQACLTLASAMTALPKSHMHSAWLNKPVHETAATQEVQKGLSQNRVSFWAELRGSQQKDNQTKSSILRSTHTYTYKRLSPLKKYIYISSSDGFPLKLTRESNKPYSLLGCPQIPPPQA